MGFEESESSQLCFTQLATCLKRSKTSSLSAWTDILRSLLLHLTSLPAKRRDCFLLVCRGLASLESPLLFCTNTFRSISYCVQAPEGHFRCSLVFQPNR